MTPGRIVDRETTRRRVIGPGRGVAGAAEVDTAKTTTALASSRMIRREAIPVVSSRHRHNTTPRTGDSAELLLLYAPWGASGGLLWCRAPGSGRPIVRGLDGCFAGCSSATGWA